MTIQRAPQQATDAGRDETDGCIRSAGRNHEPGWWAPDAGAAVHSPYHARGHLLTAAQRAVDYHMVVLDVHQRTSAPLRLLCLGAHSDDIEIGCGGLILGLVARRPRIELDWVVFSATGAREREARRSAALFMRGAARQRVAIHDFRDGFFPYDGGDIKNVFEELKTRVAPDLILTHYRDDRHQDHRLLSDLTWNTFRNHFILEYEIPKFDGDLGAPNCFAPLKRSAMARKVKYLKTVFGTQRDKHWFSDDTFMALMRLRGMECRAPDGYAEAFYARKVVIAT